MRNRWKSMLSVMFILLLYIISLFNGFSLVTMTVSAKEISYAYKGGAIEKLSSYNFKDDTKSMTYKLNEYLDSIYKEMTKIDGSTNSIVKHMPLVEINNHTCIQMPISVKVIKKGESTATGLFKNLDKIEKLQAGDKIVIKFINATTPSTYTIQSSTDLELIKKGIREFIIRARQRILRGLISQSIVIMSSSTNQVGRLSDIMEKGEDGTYSFTANFKANMNFAPVYILHPITGKIESVNSFIDDCNTLLYTGFYKEDSKIKKDNTNNYFTIDSEVKEEIKDKTDKTISGIRLHEDYKKMLEDPTNYLKNYNSIDSTDGAFDVATFPCQDSIIDNKSKETKVRPNYFMSYVYPLAVPDNYTQSGSNSQIYRMQNFPKDTPKYLCIDNIAINAKTSMVYSYDGLLYTTIGDFSDFGFQRDDIFIHSSIKTDCSLEEYGKAKTDEEKDKLRTGVAVCSKLYEGVWDTSSESANSSDAGLIVTSINEAGGLYLTGRKVVLSAKYTTDMPFSIFTSPTLQLDENGHLSKTCAKYFAFAHDVVSAKQRNQHKKTLDMSIRFQAYFLNIPPTDGEQGIYGICLVRNNFYATDTSLVNWLSSDAAKGISYVKADELIKLLTSSSTAENNILSYEDFNKMEAIREKLEHFHDNDIYSFVHKAIIILGFLIVFYGAILLLAFFFDLYDTGFNINLLSKLTFGKLKACSTADYEYVGQLTDHVYVTWKRMLIRVIACFLVGLLLVEYETLITYIIFIYQYFMDLANIK